MEQGLVSILLVGFFLGIRHSFEPDHMIAVSTVVSQHRNLFRSSLAGLFWGIGHTLTLFLCGLLTIFTKSQLSPTVSLSLEFVVGVMLVVLGIAGIYRRQRAKSAPPRQQSVDKVYRKSVMIGSVHGLAGSGALILLTMATVQEFWQGILYMLLFGAGSIIGMLLFSTLFSVAFGLVAKKAKVESFLVQFVSCATVIYGLFYMYHIGFAEKLFYAWSVQ
ncbi:sulfite exporter TauE/SafE family protein [Brevibacillus fulvus]|uniref:Sulfite exporter TauE/SafE n=1 Tax=Brevibacillus fulvus TaxID=1125967 RepID=A0A938Y150_9BACL|nr:sulfite exporter TauE/SafE family protein [Brevibacillus fulvus]MBM7591999.1 sulfite exporter TauE/SafE [Brevibacillus fulvus]